MGYDVDPVVPRPRCQIPGFWGSPGYAIQTDPGIGDTLTRLVQLPRSRRGI